MPTNVIAPYSDDFMRWDEESQRYILQEAALQQNGVDLRGRLAASKAISADLVINRFLRTVSNTVYQYIHAFNADNDMQDKIIASFEGARKIMLSALVEQGIYMSAVGDLSMETDKEKRGLVMSDHAIAELNRTIPELGAPLTYAGTWRFF